MFDLITFEFQPLTPNGGIGWVSFPKFSKTAPVWCACLAFRGMNSFIWRGMLRWVLAFGLTVSVVPAAHAQDAFKSPFFGKTVFFETSWCTPPAKDCGGGLPPIAFAADGTLTETGMGGDPIERRHPFGKPDLVEKDLRGTTPITFTTTVTGRGPSIEIVTVHKMRFAADESTEKVDRFKLTALDGSTCSLSGSREIVDRPENLKRKLVLVTKNCTYR